MTIINNQPPHLIDTHLQIDAPAPPFAAQTTLGRRRLEEYRGRWLILFSHPGDFTPVCTSEFIAFEKMAPIFKAQNCDLLGLSIDSLHSHRAWMHSIYENFGIQISFPVIDDVSMAIAHAYGMIHEGSISTATVRSVFFIDPEGILRALVHYPLNVGRSVKEIHRVLTALQQCEETHDYVLPEGWKPGDKVLRSPVMDSPSATISDPLWYYKEVDLPTGPETGT